MSEIVINEVDGKVYKTEIISERENIESTLAQLKSELENNFESEPTESELIEFGRQEHPYFELVNKINELESWLSQ